MFSRIPLVGQIVGAAVLGLILYLAIALFLADRRADKWEARAERCAEARELDRANYERAQAEAAKRNLEHVRKVEAEQEAITDEVTRNLNARLERLRRELRHNATSPNQGAAGGSGSPGSGQAPGGADEAARVCIPTSQYVLGAEYEEKLDQWITWHERQLKVRQ